MFRSRAIIIKNHHIALIKRQRAGRVYYVLPGGGQEGSETPEQTAIRESYEELGLKVVTKRLLAKVIYKGQEQFFFLCRVTGGKFGTGGGPEMTGKYAPERGTYTPVWIALMQVENIKLVPDPVGALISNYDSNGWPTSIMEFRMDE